MNNLEKNSKIEIRTDGRKSYDIILKDSFDDFLKQMEFLEIEHKKICIVTESNVAPFYLKQMYDLISSKAAKTITFSFEAGEKHKQLKTIEALYEELIINHFDRQDLLIALGGGVVGDMTGYAAATYLRGVDFLQYKNMVGAFHQPKLVYINTATLKSLPEREYFSGMGEVIKHGLIKDAKYYDWIKDNITPIKEREHEAVREMIYRSCLIKGDVVERDPKEKGERALLNFGHTLGHAIEKLKDFTWLHGECVAAGCCLAARISQMKGNLTEEEVKDIKEVFIKFGMNGDISELSIKDIIKTTKSDKKMVGDKIKFILLHSIGEAYIDMSVTDDEMENALKK